MNWFTTYKRQLQESSWLLGICENGFDDLKENHIHWINNGRYEGEKWFADPFILDYNEKNIHLLVEEFDYKIHRGRIAKLTIDRKKWVVEDCKIILELSTHLSFPMIWREADKVYVCPENYRSGRWYMYRYLENKEKLELVNEVLNEALTDAVLFSHNHNYFILSTFVPTPSGKCLSLWKSEKLMGAYDMVQKVSFNENVARNAGMIFNYGGKLVRPAQECNETYGHAISFQQVSMNEEEFSFNELYRWHSIHPKYNIGTHTYNQHPKGMAVIDVKGYRYPVMGRMLKQLDSMLEALHLKKLYRPQ